MQNEWRIEFLHANSLNDNIQKEDMYICETSFSGCLSSHQHYGPMGHRGKKGGSFIINFFFKKPISI